MQGQKSVQRLIFILRSFLASFFVAMKKYKNLLFWVKNPIAQSNFTLQIVLYHWAMVDKMVVEENTHWRNDSAAF